MLVSLPIKNNDKCISIVFLVNYLDNKYTIKPYNNSNNIFHVITYSQSYGINTLLVHFPLILTGIDNILYSDLFYIIYTLTSNNDFFYTLLNSINIYYNKQYTYNFNESNLTIINNQCTNVDTLINSMYYKTSQHLNLCLYYIHTLQQSSLKNDNVLIKIIENIYLIKINFHGNIKCINEHITYIKNNQTITKWSKFTTIANLIAHLILYEYVKLVDITVNHLYQPSYCKLLLSLYTNKDELFVLKEFTHINIIEPKYQQYIVDISNNIPHDISFNKFTEIINTHNTFNITILNNLFTNYIYPLNYNKKILTLPFAKILLYSFKFYTDILNEIQPVHDNEDIKTTLHINNKIKIPYIYILKQYKAIDTQNITMYYNTKIYIDALINTIIKILLFNDNYNLFLCLKNKINKYQQIFIENTIIINILSNITWKTISKQILVLKHIIDARQTHSQLFIVDGKINKNINNLSDYRLKKIIIEPLHMFVYLKNEADYYIWTIIFKEFIGKIFYNPIILNAEDYIKLSKIIYLLSKITVQNIENPEYNKLINYLNKNPRIIFFNERINIKIKDLFINNNLNFGFLTKHINEYLPPLISITDTNNDHIHTITQKYYK